MSELTQAEVKRLFDYRDGVLYWRIKPASNVFIGKPAGTLSKGYSRTTINGKIYLNHRLIFLYHHGYIPENIIDHIDRNTLNNNIENLRETVQQCNIRNSKQFCTNTSGVKGVCWHKLKNKWMSQININQDIKYLGLYSDFTEAVAHRLAAEQCVDWNGCDSRSPAYLYMKNYLSAGKFLLDNYVQVEENKI